jgi:hypothetical protein
MTGAGVQTGARLSARVELGDALLFLYALVFARQLFWPVADNALAWSLAAATAGALLYFYVRTKPFAPARTPPGFWLAVALPLLFVYALRAPFPDTSFDVLNYRLLHGERTLSGPLYAAGDFFPTPAPYNPAPDTLTALFRHLLGYRLGTVVNLLALVWAAQLVERLLRPFVVRAWPRFACVLLVALAEQLLFEVNTYMADLLALPLLLEATLLTLRAGEAERPGAVYVRVALLVGAGAAFKLTSVVGALPLALVCAHQALRGPVRLAPRALLRTTLLSVLAFAAPLAPFAVYLYAQTGNPFLPLLNGLFGSPFWPTGGGWDARWGPNGFFETTFWPVLAFFDPSRHTELAVYSGRLGLGFAASLAGLFVARGDRTAWTLCFVNLGGSLLWSAAGMGYGRYALYLELLSGVAVVVLASILSRRHTLGWFLILLLVVQAAYACRLVARHEWAMRPTLLSDPRAYAYESRWLLRDRALADFLPAAARERIRTTPLWVESAPKSNGIEVLLKASAPVLGARHHEFFMTRDARRRFAETVTRAGADRALSLCFPEDLAAARAALGERGLEVTGAAPLDLPFFSARRRIGMMLLEVSLPAGPEGARRLAEYWQSAPFSDSVYRADIEALDAPDALRAGERRALRFGVRNGGVESWPARGDASGRYQVTIGDRWLTTSGGLVNDLDGRTALASDLAPGARVELRLTVTAPARPGEYVLEIDMIHEGVTFFRDKGSRPLRLPVRVGP